MKPGLTRTARNIIFYTLVLVFILIAPLLIAYSYGYRFDFVRGRLVGTGGIFVKSAIPSLSIFLNNRFVKETSFISGGALLPEVRPGTYLLRIEKEGFQPWSKTVKVEPAIVTELRFIHLVPKPVVSATSTRAEIALASAPEVPADKRFVLKGNKLMQKTATSTRTLASNVYSFGAFDGMVYFVGQNGFLAKIDLNTGVTETIGRPGFFLEGKAVQFFKSTAGDVAIIDPAGGLLILDSANNINLIDKNVKKITFDSEGQKALAAGSTVVKVLWLSDNPYQPFEKRGEIDTILSLDIPVLDAYWFYGDDAHVVIRTKEGIFFTEIDGRGGRSTVELVSGPTDGLVTRPDSPNKIFYKLGKTWYTTEL